MKQEEKQNLASSLKNAADEMLSLSEMENVEGGAIVDLNSKCVHNNVAGCGCSGHETTVGDKPKDVVQ